MAERNGNNKVTRAIVIIFVTALIGGASTSAWKLADSVGAAHAKNGQQDSVLADDHAQRALDRQTWSSDMKTIRRDQAAVLALLNLWMDEQNVSKLKRAAAILNAKTDSLTTDSTGN